MAHPLELAYNWRTPSLFASVGLVVCLAGGLGWLATDLPVWPAIVLLFFAAVAVVDIVVIIRRKARGEPG